MSSIIPIFIPHTGCPMDCVFCNQRRISGSLLPATAQDIERETRAALMKLPCGSKPQIAFYGGSFTAIPAMQQIELLEAAYAFIESGEVSSIRLSTRPDAIDSERLDRLERYGVSVIELGSQSMDDEVLELTNRGHTAEDTVRAAALIKERGFSLILQMMTGLPGSTPERDIETARKIAALRPDGVRIYPTVIVRDTALYEMWLRGEYREHTVDEAVAVCAKIVPIFSAAGIPVIRLGLNPTEELSGGSAVGGAYHPALGELVLSRIYLERLLPMLEPYHGPGTATVSVHPSRVSVMVGQHRKNAEEVRRLTGLGLKVVGTAAEKDEIRLVSVAKE
jgi:histone acetyltransferase (RNA polymerase elongator complex component)